MRCGGRALWWGPAFYFLASGSTARPQQRGYSGSLFIGERRCLSYNPADEVGEALLGVLSRNLIFVRAIPPFRRSVLALQLAKSRR